MTQEAALTVQDASGWSGTAGLPEAGSAIGPYVIEEKLSEGGMSAVFAARHRVLGKRVALKVLLPNLRTTSDVIERFAREGPAAAALAHPNAVDIIDMLADERGTQYLVMELLEGEDLSQRLARAGRLSVEEAADILVPIASAIASAHDHGIVHRDLKPENIFLARRRDGIVPKVVDFGISKSLRASLVQTGTQMLLGTPDYMSPEQAQGSRDIDVRSDQFSLGVVLYECVTGVRPFDGEALVHVFAAIMNRRQTPPSALESTLPAALDAIVDRALQKQPDARFSDMRAFGAALAALASPRVQLSYAKDFALAEARHGAPSAVAPTHTPWPGAPASETYMSVPVGSASETRTPASIAPASAASGRSSEPRASQVRLSVDRIVGVGPAPQRVEVVAPVAPASLAPVAKRRPLRLAAAALAGLLMLGGYTASLSRREGSSGPPGSVLPSANSAAPPAPPHRPAHTGEEDTLAHLPRGVALGERAPNGAGRGVASYQVDLTVEPAQAWIALDGKPAGKGRLQRRLPLDRVEHTLRIGAPGYVARVLTFTDEAPPSQVILEKRSEPGTPPGGTAKPSGREPATGPNASPREGANGALILR